MTKKVVLTPAVVEGDAGCRAVIKEFNVGIGAPSRDVALSGLLIMVNDHCHTLVSRDDTSDATPEQLELARSIVENGVEFR